MDIKPNIKNGFGPLTTRGFNKLAAKVNERKRFRESSDGSKQSPIFIAIIMGNTVVVTGRRWKYTWALAHMKSDKTFEARSGASLTYTNTGEYAYNTCESLQQAAGTHDGPGLTHTNIPSGLSLQAIATGTCVLMFMSRSADSKLTFAFSLANAIDGTCS